MFEKLLGDLKGMLQIQPYTNEKGKAMLSFPSEQ